LSRPTERGGKKKKEEGSILPRAIETAGDHGMGGKRSPAALRLTWFEAEYV